MEIIKEGVLIPVILIVDDDRSIRELIRDYLEDIYSNYPCRAEEATDGLEGLEKFKAIPEVVAIITDVEMPGLNGLDLTKQLKDANPKIAVIVMSANNDFGASALSAGADAFLEKPFSDMGILERLLEKPLRAAVA